MRRCSVQDTKNYSVPTHPLSWWALKSPTRSATWVIENRSFLDPTQPAIMEIYPPTDLLDWSIAGAGRRAHTGVRWVYFHNSTLLKKWAVRAAASSASREGGADGIQSTSGPQYVVPSVVDYVLESRKGPSGRARRWRDPGTPWWPWEESGLGQLWPLAGRAHDSAGAGWLWAAGGSTTLYVTLVWAGVFRPTPADLAGHIRRYFSVLGNLKYGTLQSIIVGISW